MTDERPTILLSARVQEGVTRGSADNRHAVNRDVLAALGPDALIALPNAVLTPHIAGSTRQSERGRQQMVLADVRAYFAGHALPTPVPDGDAGPNP